ncbi:hypothetical protein F0919_14510 [Taibaiella lutea]|uniref:Uncharacterized protein n=1 Tax=Taibaiella lutea TaxID=2608001 RepID=A0A5M6CF41_9BACT|nr:hypothetical protein [Taibaiella lutea]KAA5533741.1 hypothetical protein F0919_14510 [Taibaiella lutea]
MTRYWFEFDFNTYEKKIPPGLCYGCGITARDYNHAISLLKDKIFLDKNMPPISKCIENVDINTLDESKVIPNMTPPIYMGIWFPMRYQ